jgi:hypothetical protein
VRLHTIPRVTALLVAAAIIAQLVAACSGLSNPAAASGNATALMAADQSGVPGPDSFPSGPVPGNSVTVPLPSDAPPSVRNLGSVPSCGAEILFEQDVDLSPIPTAPGPVTNAAANKQATDCLIAAWENGLAARLDVSAVSDEGDVVFSIYRLPGNGTLSLIVRVYSHADKTVTWTETTCRQLSLQDGTPTPADCDTEKPIR